jgi:dienelactone hydrolase
MKLHQEIATPILVFCLLSLVPGAAAQGEDLAVLGGWIQWSNAPNLLQQQLNSLAFQQLASRKAVVRSLLTADAWRARQADVRKALQEILGPFPERTPLNAQVRSILKKDGYRIEKIVFESQPKFFVTGCLFVPNRQGSKLPAILNVIGHTDISFRSPFYQHLLLNLVRKGFIVFAVDPVGQGERLQYYDPEQRRSLVGSATAEHSYFGRQCFLTGSSAARYFAWDGIRAIDYLISRPEVDPTRIGVTGISGGGTQTSYIAALDDRVAAAAPACYITGFRRLLESIGPQDAEQNLNSGLLRGIDHADYLEVRAPRPTLVVATTRDFFSIQGAHETFAEAKEAFRLLGAEENLSMAEDDLGHGYSRKTREAIYRFFQQHLHNPGNGADEDVELLPVQEVTVTQTGQLSDSLGGETVFSLNRTEAEKLEKRLEIARESLASHLGHVKNDALRISGYRSPGTHSGEIFRGRYARPGYAVEMYALEMDEGNPLPALLLMPEAGLNHGALVYLSPQGKASATTPGGEIEQFIRQGLAVLAPDLSGTGELGRTSDALAFLGVLTGRSIVAVRAAEIARCIRFLRSRPGIDSAGIGAIARGSMAVPLLHAAAFDDSIRRVALIEPLVSFHAVAASRYYTLEPGAIVANVLTAYDLPDLAASLAPRKLAIIDAVDQLQKPAGPELLAKSYDVVRRSYRAQQAEDSLIIEATPPGRQLSEILRAWLE